MDLKAIVFGIVMIFGIHTARADEYFVPKDAEPIASTQTAEEEAKQLAEQAGGKVVRVATTGSMAPTITGGDLVVYRPAQYSEVRKGDIIMFTAQIEGAERWQTSLFCHRVASIDRIHRIWTKGDAYKDLDHGPVDESEFKGIVAYIVKANGQVVTQGILTANN